MSHASSPHTSHESSPHISDAFSPHISNEPSLEISHASSPHISYESSPHISHAFSTHISHESNPHISHASSPHISHESNLQISHASSPHISHACSPQISYASSLHTSHELQRASRTSQLSYPGRPTTTGRMCSHGNTRVVIKKSSASSRYRVPYIRAVSVRLASDVGSNRESLSMLVRLPVNMILSAVTFLVFVKKSKLSRSSLVVCECSEYCYSRLLAHWKRAFICGILAMRNQLADGAVQLADGADRRLSTRVLQQTLNNRRTIPVQIDADRLHHQVGGAPKSRRRKPKAEKERDVKDGQNGQNGDVMK
ncbi:hypothetical protein MAR_000819 [Mya arenaria]|uniref:Uncharacterized protein n=1 Tax=Mya arenaria TaxID=6604 RepID=A0ABY7FDY7_MYAAR|nr:hypothetical protein MAR_000819 [Mya arenaria]